jgi:RNA polymerase sigma-70 factor (ECF subfamily)
MSELSPAETLSARGGSNRRGSDGFDEFYVSELPRLVALARGLCGSEIAEDVAQEAMLVAFRRWRELAAMQRPDLWVRRACANLAVSQFRRRVIELRATARLAGRRTVTPELSEPAEDFWAAVRRLPHRQARRRRSASSTTCRSPTSPWPSVVPMAPSNST